MGVFVWSVENSGEEELDISIAFTFKNGRGVKEDSNGENRTEAFDCDSEGQHVSGVMIHQTMRDIPCTYSIAAAQKVSYQPQVQYICH